MAYQHKNPTLDPHNNNHEHTNEITQFQTANKIYLITGQIQKYIYICAVCIWEIWL